MDKINYEEPYPEETLDRGLNYKQKETLSYLLFDYLSKIGTKTVGK